MQNYDYQDSGNNIKLKQQLQYHIHTYLSHISYTPNIMS